MTWFSDWWDGMSILQQTFAIVAIPATVILILQTILLLIGIGSSHDIDHGEVADGHGEFGDHGDFDSDINADHELDFDQMEDYDAADTDAHDMAHHDVGLRIFTIRGIVAFFAVGGWLGIVLGDTGLHPALTILLAFLGGVAALVGIAFLLKWSLRLQDQGNLDLRNAIGKTAQVYIPIPADGVSFGKVTLTLQERYVELNAITTAHTDLRTNQMVKVTGIVNQTTLVVKPLTADAAPAKQPEQK